MIVSDSIVGVVAIVDEYSLFLPHKTFPVTPLGADAIYIHSYDLLRKQVVDSCLR